MFQTKHGCCLLMTKLIRYWQVYVLKQISQKLSDDWKTKTSVRNKTLINDCKQRKQEYVYQYLRFLVTQMFNK